MLSDFQLKDLTILRHYLHQHPEVSGQERQTARVILKNLSPLRPDQIITDVGGHGIIATFDSGRPGLHLLFRAEIDALPIQEVNTFDYASQYPGVSHKCGHEGHSCILMGLAIWLCKHRPKSGKVSLLFQPAEETGAGAAAMLADPKMQDIQPDYVFALHNLPGHPLGEVLIRRGPITAAVRSMIIKLHGKTAHAAEPENGNNPSFVIANLLQEIQQFSNNDLSRADFKVITPVHITVGEKAYGVAAGYGELHLTIRSWSEEIMQDLIEEIMQEINQQCQLYDLKSSIEWTDAFLGNTNDDDAVDAVLEATQQLDYPLRLLDYPLKWGEDFGYFTQRFLGAFFGLGAGKDCPALHNPDYDFPDALIEKGVELFGRIIAHLLDD